MTKIIELICINHLPHSLAEDLALMVPAKHAEFRRAAQQDEPGRLTPRDSVDEMSS